MIDESAHKVFDYGMKDWHDFRTHKCSHCSRQLDIYYCESRLYLVRCKHCKIVSLVEAGNPNEAAEKVSHRTQQPNKPLTVEELRKMDGGPVWCTWINGWALIYIDGNSELEFVYHDGSYHTFDELKHLLHECKLPFTAYRRPPEAGEKE